MNARRNRKSLVVIAALVAATAGTTANAELLQMEFTATYAGYNFLEPFASGLAIISGTVVWDSEATSFGGFLDNIHYWEYISFDAVGTLILTDGPIGDGIPFNFTINSSPPNGDNSNAITTTFAPSFNFSNMDWKVEIGNTIPGFVGGDFEIGLGGVGAMSEATSPLPSTVAQYEDNVGVNSDFELRVTNFDTLRFNLASAIATITPYEPPILPCLADINGDGALNFLDISAYLSAFSAGCP